METAHYFLIFLVFLMYLITIYGSSQEGFDNKDEGTVLYEDSDQIYDKMYASIYDLLWNANDETQYMQVSMQDIAFAELPKKSVSVADLACGTAPMACWFKNELGVDYVGVDTSESMISRARYKCPTAKFQKGDIMQIHLFSPKSLTHCIMTKFSIYMFQNPKIIADNAYYWLKPGGYFIVHLVDPDKFDPLLNLASPFAAFSLQKYSYERQSKSIIYFNDFKYIGDFKKTKGEDDAVYEETFIFYDKDKNDGNKYREHKHHLIMPSKERMIDIFKTSGFRHEETVDLVRCGKEYQYLVYFTK